MIPKAKKIPFQHKIHGQEILDNYQWMRDKNWPNKITDQNIIAYLNEENEYYHNFVKSNHHTKIIQEFKSRMVKDHQFPYIKKGDFYYYHKIQADKDFNIYCRKQNSIENDEEIILDVNKLAEGKTFTKLYDISVSANNDLLAYSIDHQGDQRCTIKIINLNESSTLADEIRNTSGTVIWHENRNGFFYIPLDEHLRMNEIKFHLIGDKIENDITVFKQNNQLYSCSIYKTSAKNLLVISVSSKNDNYIHAVNMQQDQLISTPILPLKKDIMYEIDEDKNHLYVMTNDNAPDFHILKSKLYETENKLFAKYNLELYIPEMPGQYLKHFDATKNYLLLNYSESGISKLVLHNVVTNSQEIIGDFPEKVFYASIYSTNFETQDIRIYYSSFLRRGNIYKYNLIKKQSALINEQKIENTDFNYDDYEIRRVFTDNSDVQVPVTLFYKKSLNRTKMNKTVYLYGYGSYGISLEARFSNFAFSIVERDMIYAIAHIRGGRELGEKWYQDGKMLNKEHSFEDFINVSRYLIDKNYTTVGNIIPSGGSAGGMLVATVINQCSELYKAAILHVPFVDVLNTMLDETLPLTPGEFNEWGNPKNIKYFKYIQKYSPYDNIKKQRYPHIFVTTGLYDILVGYWEVAKWVAKLREIKIDDNHIIFKTNMHFGHQGSAGRFSALDELAEEIIFIESINDL